jgi:hypothetical protein
MTMIDENSWVWWDAKQADRCSGPFASEQEAEADARAHFQRLAAVPTHPRIYLGHPVGLSPAETICQTVDFEDLLCRLDEQEDFYEDDILFDVPQQHLQSAKEDLQNVLAAWASRWVKASAAWLGVEVSHQVML